MALVTASHHSLDRVHAEHAAPRSQRTGTRAGEGEVFELREAPRGQSTPHPGKRPEPLEEVSEPQAGIRRHAGVGYELVLDLVVPQMVEQLVDVFAMPALAVEYISPAPAVSRSSAPVVESFAPAPAVFSSPVPVVEYSCTCTSSVSSTSRVFLTRTRRVSSTSAIG